MTASRYGSWDCCRAKSGIGSDPSSTAAVMVSSGIKRTNSDQSLMDKFGFKDPIARRRATAYRFVSHPNVPHLYRGRKCSVRDNKLIASLV